MTQITFDTFWYPENQEISVKWIALTLFLLTEAERNEQPPPSVDEIKAKLGISDEAIAAYLLAGTQHLSEKLRQRAEAKQRDLKRTGPIQPAKLPLITINPRLLRYIPQKKLQSLNRDRPMGKG